MPGLGTLINTVTVLVGGVLGLRFGARIPERVRTSVVHVIGLTTLAIGISDVLKTHNIVFPLVGMALGTVMGELLRIEDRLFGLGEWLRNRFARSSEASKFSTGFVNATMLFCVGPLTILGAIQDGLGVTPQLYIIKASLDGFMSLVFASVYGVGAIFSAVSVFFVQGTLTLFGSQLDALLNDRMQIEMFAAGGLAVLAIGLNLLGLTKIRLGSLLPGLVVTPLLVALFADTMRPW
jgi:uncharacterized membrane protein YqgA involved in biofilm formation